MNIYLAPLEGITNYLFRSVFHKYYAGIDRFYTPFLSPNQNKSFITKEWNEILPEHNEGIEVIPQLLTRNADHFLWACAELHKLGYTHVNLNLGCPSGTVVAKRKGSGLLTDPAELDEFLSEIFAATPLEISIKTRIGRYIPEEFDRIMDIYNQYPVKELIVHPRVQKQFYKGNIHIDAFSYAEKHSLIPLCYNGDLFSTETIQTFCTAHPNTSTVMLGRGVIANPALAEECRGTGQRSKERLRQFHDELFHRYDDAFSGEHAVLSHLKEVWFYQLPLFTNYEKYLKPLRKATHYDSYLAIVGDLFANQQLTEGSFTPP